MNETIETHFFCLLMEEMTDGLLSPSVITPAPWAYIRGQVLKINRHY